MEITSAPNTRTRTMYGITERKKEEIDNLTIKVENAQYKVEQFQAMVDSLTIKSNEFTEFLNVAETEKETALNHKRMVETVVNYSDDLQSNAQQSYTLTNTADEKIHTSAQDMKKVVNQLIFASEIINKLSILINRKKEMNIYISDDMVSMINKAGTDINNAFALSLTALQSCYTSLTSSMESAATADLGAKQSQMLLEKLKRSSENKTAPIFQLIENDYKDSVKSYNKALDANNKTTKELENAQAKLNEANTKLKSLQAGLAAAKAAALA